MESLIVSYLPPQTERERHRVWPFYPEYLHSNRCIEKEGLLEAYLGNCEMIREMFPETQSGLDHEGFIWT